MYCTLADLTARFHPDDLLTLTDDDHDGLADAPVIEAAIAEAAAEIDLFLGARYAVPFADPPETLRPLAAALAAHRLYLRRRQALSPEHAAEYARAVAALAAIARGEFGLAGVASRHRPAATKSVDEKAMSEAALEKF